MIWNNPFVHGSVMIRKKAIETVGYYNESFKYVQDYELWARVAVSYKLQNIPTVLIKRMVTKTSITYNPLIMKERSLYAFKAHISVLKTLKMPIYYYIFVFKRFARCMLFNLDIVNQPIINKKDYLKSIFG